MFIVMFIIFVIISTYILSNQNIVLHNNQNISESKKNNVDHVVIKFKDNKYDITDFIKKHPGGKQVLFENNGNDVEKIMIENEHSTHAYEVLEKYKIKI